MVCGMPYGFSLAQEPVIKFAYQCRGLPFILMSWCLRNRAKIKDQRWLLANSQTSKATTANLITCTREGKELPGTPIMT